MSSRISNGLNFAFIFSLLIGTYQSKHIEGELSTLEVEPILIIINVCTLFSAKLICKQNMLNIFCIAAKLILFLQNWAFVARFCFLSEEGRFQYTIQYDQVRFYSQN
jgi:hypothetical protein